MNSLVLHELCVSGSREEYRQFLVPLGGDFKKTLEVEETTLERASTSVRDCVCKENSYREVGHAEGNSSFGSCLGCQKDLQGNWIMERPPSNDVPRILAGFWASPGDRVTRVCSIFSCRSEARRCGQGGQVLRQLCSGLQARLIWNLHCVRQQRRKASGRTCGGSLSVHLRHRSLCKNRGE